MIIIIIEYHFTGMYYNQDMATKMMAEVLIVNWYLFMENQIIKVN